MKTCTKNLFLLPALIADLGLIPAGRVTAQTFTNLHNFTALSNSTNSDGTAPAAGLILLGNTLYGTAVGGGSSGHGTVFAVNTNGTGFTNLHSFTGGSYPYTNNDGAYPKAGLILSGSTLYGTANQGGSSGYSYGAVFKINTTGTGFAILHSFTATFGSGGLYGTNNDGVYPEAGLILSGNTLYGTTEYQNGTSGPGTVFAVNTNGTGFTNLHSFNFSDGGNPSGGLILSGNTLYGTTYSGGSSGVGTVFKVNTDGTGFTNLYSFTATYAHPPGNNTNSDGAFPGAGLILSGNTLYGTAEYGGSSGNGTVFAINTDGTGFTTFHSFTATASSYPHTNSDGANPQAGLVLSGNTLYGTAGNGGSSGNGTAFSLSFSPPPQITVQPGSQAVALGATAFFSVGAIGGSPLGYQWQFNGANFSDNARISGSQSNALTIANIFGSDAGSYQVIVSNVDGSVTSAVATLVVGLPGQASEQILHFFAGINSGDGSDPNSLLQGTDGELYGTTYYGGTNYGHFPGDGTVFKLNTNGTGYAVLYRFNNAFSANIDGQNSSGLAQGNDGRLYGTTWLGSSGGPSGEVGPGTVFRLNTNGTGYGITYVFGGVGGGFRPVGLVQGSDLALYGTTAVGGTNGYGTVFRLNTSGSGYADLHSFGVSSGDGLLPEVGVLQARDGALYGTTPYGGTNGLGTVFRLNTSGAGYAVIHNFSTNGDGQFPSSALVQGRDGGLYGTTSGGGLYGSGAVFKLSTNGAGHIVLQSFGADANDGRGPRGVLLQGSDGALYGTTSGGGLYGFGTVYKLGTNGAGHSVLYSFGANANDRDGPSGALLQGRDGALYGTTSGGNFGGTVFRLTLPPQITTQPTNQSVLLGSTATLTAAASGAPPLFFQWQHNGANLSDNGHIAGSHGNVLAIGNASGNDAGSYRVIVTNAYGSVTSVGAGLIVGPLIVLPSFQFEIAGPGNIVNLRALLATNSPNTSFAWCAEGGLGQPDQVLFTDPASANTTVLFGFAGTYVLSVTAFDGTNRFESSVTVTVDLNPTGAFQNVTTFLTATDPASNTNKFLTYGGLFGVTPNTNDGATATNYYQAIDPTNLKTNLTKWKIANGIPTNAIPAFTNGAVVSAAYFNSGDLGFGRRMIMGGTGDFPAFAVSNFTNVDDAISGSNLIATVAMEYSPGTNGATFTKFYVFDGNGNRITEAALDGAGKKFVPGLCIVCHGGFNTAHAVPYPNAGNVQAHFLPFDLGSFDYSCVTNFSRSAQEPAFKRLNQGVLAIEQSYAVNNTNRRPAIIELIQGWYGTNSGTNLPSPVQNASFVPSGWQDGSMEGALSLPLQSYLYLNVVAPPCRSCHVTRPASADFSSFSQFHGLKASTQNDVFGTFDTSFLFATPIVITNNTAIKMPQARRTFECFWTSVAPRPQAEILRDYLIGQLAGYSTPPSSITGVEKNGSDLNISFETILGGSYRLEQADTLTNSSNWIPLNGDISGTGGTNQVFEPIVPSVPNRFFRIRSLP